MRVRTAGDRYKDLEPGIVWSPALEASGIAWQIWIESKGDSSPYNRDLELDRLIYIPSDLELRTDSFQPLRLGRQMVEFKLNDAHADPLCIVTGFHIKSFNDWLEIRGRQYTFGKARTVTTLCYIGGSLTSYLDVALAEGTHSVNDLAYTG